jgi:hypothetical protein
MRPYWWYPPNDGEGNGGGDGRPYPWYPPNGERHPVIVIPRPGILPPVLGWTEPITAWIPATLQVPFDVVIGADGEPEAVFPHVTADEVADWRRAGELTDLEADLVGQGLALIAGGGVVWRYAERATAKLRVEVETDATTWTAPAAARTPTWD